MINNKNQSTYKVSFGKFKEYYFGEKSSKTLVVFLHGMNSSPITIKPAVKIVEEELQSCYIIVPELPLQWNKYFNLKQFANEYLNHINSSNNLSDYDSIILIGHSAGGLIIQAMYILANEDEELNKCFSYNKVRIVQIASLNRGWEISHHLPLPHKIGWSVGLFLLPLISNLRFKKIEELWVMQLRKGSSFLVWLKLKWLKLNNSKLPLTIHLLGSIDEIVSWQDMVNVKGANFFYFEVPNSNHVELIDVEDKEHGDVRGNILRIALRPKSEMKLNKYSIKPWDQDPDEPNEKVKRVVFVIHGIRDEGHWTQKIASRARRMYERAGLNSRNEIAIVTSSYGYFSMYDFLSPKARQKKVHWLMDEYAEAKRKFPSAKFSYVGHSNGTYLLASALKQYPLVEFERIVFAGSVVSSNYNWNSIDLPIVRNESEGTSKNVLNISSSADWVVAIFTQIADLLPLNWLLGKDLGGAGIKPFSDEDKVINLKYKVGGHGAGISEDNWDIIADFTVSKKITIPSINNSYNADQNKSLNNLKGIVGCISGWAIILLSILYLLPITAFKAPLLFWGVPIVLCLIVGLIVAIIQSPTLKDNFIKRKKINKLIKYIILSFALILLFLYMILMPIFTLNGNWLNFANMLSIPHYFVNNPHLSTASLLFYIFGLNSIFKKV